MNKSVLMRTRFINASVCKGRSPGCGKKTPRRILWVGSNRYRTIKTRSWWDDGRHRRKTRALGSPFWPFIYLCIYFAGVCSYQACSLFPKDTSACNSTFYWFKCVLRRKSMFLYLVYASYSFFCQASTRASWIAVIYSSPWSVFMISCLVGVKKQAGWSKPWNLVVHHMCVQRSRATTPTTSELLL